MVSGNGARSTVELELSTREGGSRSMTSRQKAVKRCSSATVTSPASQSWPILASAGWRTPIITSDGLISLERIECQAACTHGPVMTANWEFLDDMDVPRALEVVEKLQRGEEVFSTRGPRIGTFEEIERSLAGFDDGLADQGGKDDRMLAGLTVAQERGMTAPEGPAESPLIALAQKTEG